MKTAKTIAILTLILFAITGHAFAADENPCDKINIEWMRAHVPIPPAEIVSKAPESGLCQVILKIRGEFVPTYAGENFVLAGEMFRDRKQVTQAKLETLQAAAATQNIEKLETVVAMTYTPENSNGKSVYFLTDPICPYCNRAGKELQSLADRSGVTFKLVFANVHGQKGEAKIREAICSGYDFAKYNTEDWKKQPPQNTQCAAADDLWGRTKEVVAQMGIRGVPAFFTEDGVLVSGANMPKLEEAIKRMTGDKLQAKAD